MVPPNIPSEAPRPAETPAEGTSVKLETLRNQVTEGKMQEAVDTLIDLSDDNDAELMGKADEFVRSLTPEQVQTMTDFLSGTEDPAKTALKTRLEALRAEMGGEAPTESALPGPVQKILDAIDQGIERAGITGKLSELGAKFGFKGEIGPKQVEFVKSMLVGFAARLVEGVVLSLKRVNPTADISAMMNTSLELRLLGIKDAEQREKYRAAYLAWAQNPTTPNPPTLQQALNPAAPAPAATPSAAPAETPAAEPAAPETVESSKIVSFPDGSANLEIVRGSDQKVTLTADGKKAELKVLNMQSVAVRAPAGEDKGIVEMKLADGSTVSTEPSSLRDAVRDGTAEILASDGRTKIELPTITPA